MIQRIRNKSIRSKFFLMKVLEDNAIFFGKDLTIPDMNNRHSQCNMPHSFRRTAFLVTSNATTVIKKEYTL